MYLAGLLLIIMVLIILLGSIILVKYYVDPSESYLLATIVISVSITLTLLNVLMIPIDILVISRPNYSFHKEDVDNLMRQMYLLTFLVNFILIPFTYFYGEERQEQFEVDFEYEESKDNMLKRILSAIKQTVILDISIATILIMILFFKYQ
jgi:LMBR1 domain-containing protein 1